ncbi:hypothetical protein IP88_07460 [alpha proteobacterium AAP81b]|nr:hypothetical protein IP88_07460 [alpha proteobacterium AAP81b]
MTSVGDTFASILVLAIVFVAVVLVVLALAPMFTRNVDMRARLSTTTPTPAINQSGGPSLRTDQTQSVWARLITEIEKRGLSLTDTKGDVLAERLMLAGYEQPFAVRAFVLARTVLTVALPLILLGFLALTNNLPSPTWTYFYVILAAVVGLYLPNFIISSRAGERRKEILNGFPDTLDLMLVCIEAGLGIDATFARIGAEITTSHPLLAQLFANVSLELRAGRSREQALKTLARKSGVPEIAAFTTLIIQSDRLGASIAQALRIYAAEMREGRKMRAEEKAHRIPVLLSVPLVCFLLPVMIAVLMLPAAIGMKRGMATSAASSVR